MRNDWTLRGEAVDRCDAAVGAGLGWLDRCSALFGAPPRALTLHLDAAARPATCDRTIRVPAALLRRAGRGEPAARLILAHEAAHLAQFARPGAGQAWPVCEAEAALAAVSAMAGRGFVCRASALPGAALHWGLVGHYYTVYLMALACGATAEQAFRMALYTQIPDLVAELDAVECAKDYFALDSRRQQIRSYYHAGEAALAEGVIKITGPVLQAGVVVGGIFSPWTFKDTLRNAELVGAGTRHLAGLVADEGVNQIIAAMRAEAQLKLDLDVQRGLHCLTGRPAIPERRKREAILRDLDWGSREFGLALHAYGDSFAHTRLDGSMEMYSTGLGHLRDLHAPDVVSKHADTYLLYCRSLYSLMSRKSPRKLLDESAAMGLFEALLQVGQAAEKVAYAQNIAEYKRTSTMLPAFLPRAPPRFVNAEAAEENLEMATIRKWVREPPFNAPAFYAPPDEAIPWSAFHASWSPAPKVWPAADELPWMLGRAVAWAGDD